MVDELLRDGRWHGGLWTPEVEAQCDIRSFAELCQFISKNVPLYVQVLETGTTFHTDPVGYDTYSTPNLLKWIVNPARGLLSSLDLEFYPQTLQVLKAMDVPWERRLQYHYGDSVNSIADMYGTVEDHRKFDVVHLDSAEDVGGHMMNEFYALEALLAPQHYLMIDDIHNPASGKYKMLVPWLQNMAEYDCMQVPTAMGTFLAARGLPLPRKT